MGAVSKNKIINNRITISQFEFVQKEMARTGQGQGEVLRELLAEAISNRKKAK